jgi:YesN/AraC family two-component response regulator
MYQNELLIEKAIDMFKKNDGNVSEVSDALGFSNPFYFSRVFKKITGVSPTTYINENYRYQ